MAKIFISYAREDYPAAKRLYDALGARGHDPWLDQECILPGQRWQAATRAAIRKSDFFLALLSPHSVEKRGYVQKELKIGLELLEYFPESKIFLIPVRLNECEPDHELLRELQWVDLFPDWDKGWARLNKVFDFVPPEVRVPDLAETRWTVESSDGRSMSLYLRKDHVVEKRVAGRLHVSGTWKVSGESFYMEFNQQYSQYRGVFDGKRLTGNAQNVSGREWTWTAVEEKSAGSQSG